MTAVAGLRGSGDWATDERPKDFRNFILWRNPNGDTPVTALLGRASKDKPADPEFNWWDEPNDIVRLQVNYTTGYTSTTTTLIVDSADPSSSAPGNVYGEATHLKPGDLLQVEKTETSAFDNEIVMVTAVTDSQNLTIVRGQAGTTADTIADNAFLTLIGSAYAEGTAAANATSRNPIKYTNYCQIFKTTYEVTNTAKGITNLRTGDLLKNERMRKVFDHSRQLEFAMLMGKPSETTGDNGKPLRFMGGLRHFIPTANQTIFTTSPTVNTFLDAVYPVFDYSTGAGDERMLLCGNQFLNEINKLAKTDGQIQFDEVVKVYGMNMRRYILPQGTLYLRTHPLMNRHGRWKASAFVIDWSSLRYRPFRDTKSEDNIQVPGTDEQKGQWLTEASLEVRFGGLTNAYIGNFII